MALEDLPQHGGDGQPVATRTCSRCHGVFPASTIHFSPIKARNTLHSWCKPCCAEDRRARRAANPEHDRAILKRCRERNLESFKARNRARWPEYAEKNAAALAERRQARKDTYNKTRREKYAADPARRTAAAIALAGWMGRNREITNERRRAKWAKRSNGEKLRTYFGAAISHSLKGRTKGGKGWQAILGYTADDLRAHLERQFQRGMTWDNYGEWHVDHILPVASFQYETVDSPEFLACWALTNLRPLWARDNIVKRHNRTHLI